jgi:type II secretory pathway pseudopilin PulG
MSNDAEKQATDTSRLDPGPALAHRPVTGYRFPITRHFRVTGSQFRVTGFTFVEVLATMTLLAIVLPSIVAGVTASLSAAGLARQRAQAAGLAQSKLADLAAEGQWQFAQQGGDFAPQRPEFRWSAQVGDWDGSTLRQLDVVVSWRHRGMDYDLRLSTLVETEASP